MIRVTSKRSGSKSIVQIDGALRSEFLEELGRAVADVEPPVTLDLSHLQSVDSESTEALVEMAKDSAEVIGASPYIRLLLERYGLELED
jgi:anti-anti-sigma regulatory factor